MRIPSDQHMMFRSSSTTSAIRSRRFQQGALEIFLLLKLAPETVLAVACRRRAAILLANCESERASLQAGQRCFSLSLTYSRIVSRGSNTLFCRCSGGNWKSAPAHSLSTSFRLQASQPALGSHAPMPACLCVVVLACVVESRSSRQRWRHGSMILPARCSGRLCAGAQCGTSTRRGAFLLETTLASGFTLSG